MAEGPDLEIALPNDVPILADLARLAEELARRGEVLRVVGGVAMTVWGLALKRPRGVATNDIDAVVPRAAAEGEAAIRAFARTFRAAADATGYASPGGSKPADRFAFVNRADPGPDRRKIEILTPPTTVGRMSKRPPPMRQSP